MGLGPKTYGFLSNFFNLVFCIYLVDGYFEIGSSVLDKYFFNELIPWTY